MVETTAYLALKRTADVSASALGLAVLSPLLAVLGFLIKRQDGGPVLYLGTRVGKDGQHFKLWKFRTMVHNADQIGASVTTAGDPRITPLGKRLRHTKLDELPSLLNVLRGEMSLVGPRPETPPWVAQYTPEMHEVLRVPPGVTDVAQIIFRHEEQMLQGETLNEQQYLAIMRWKVTIQKEYLRHRSFLVDLRIIVWTLLAILDREPDPELVKLVRQAQDTATNELPPVLRQRVARLLGKSDAEWLEAGRGAISIRQAVETS